MLHDYLIKMPLLNRLVALVPGERSMRAGLVAAVGAHCWADVIRHGLWPWIARVRVCTGERTDAV